MKYTMLAQLGDWTFFEVQDHGFTGPAQGRSLFTYEKVSDPGDPGKPNHRELYKSLDRAIIAAVGEKYTGPRGAGGTGVGTAADWFARMIGMDALVEPDYETGRKAVSEALVAARSEAPMPSYRRARMVADELEARGLVLAVRSYP